MSPAARVRIGLISDTHGLLRPQALDLLAGTDHIVHAGDVCDASILETLAAIAPVTAVRGNNDHGAWADSLPHRTVLRTAGRSLLVIHDVGELSARQITGIDIVIHGHSHRPLQHLRDGVLYINPGSAGPRRFSLPVAAACLHLGAGEPQVEFVEWVPAGTR